jgi:hypothetical protein
MILNTANDRNFVQNTFVTIVMPNLHELQQGMSTQQLGSNLGQALNFGLLGSAY